jgi:hypothetical protein
MMTTQNIWMNEEAAELAVHLAQTLTTSGQPVLVTLTNNDIAPGQTITVQVLSEPPEGDRPDPSGVVMDAGHHIIVWPKTEITQAPMTRRDLGFRVCRTGKPEARVISELRDMIDLATRLGYNRLWIMVDEEVSQAPS